MKATRIRAITVGINPEECHPAELTDRLDAFYRIAELAFQDAGFPVQTRRLTLTPANVTDAAGCYKLKSTLDTLDRVADHVGVRWLCQPFSGQMELSEEVIRIIVNMISQHPKVFAHFLVTENGNIASGFSNSAAKAVLAISRLSNNGYDNFRVGIGANIKPNTPYFPFSYHEGATGFSLAVELIEHLVQAVDLCDHLSLALIREHLIATITPIIKEIDQAGIALEEQTGFIYKGQDISIAPYPDAIRSVAGLIEKLGPTHCGQSGTLMVTSLLTDVLKTAIMRTNIRYTGFNGVMFSPLEDRELANANNQRHLSMEKLMLYSTVCGCGIDMVPVPGDVFAEEINSLILDVAALSTVLQKPLGVRILPIPMKAANELTDFNHDFLTNTRIMRIDGQHLSFPLSTDNHFRYLRFEESTVKESGL